MRALVAWADDTSTNLGVRALAQGTAALVGRTFPGAAVDFQNFGKGAAPMRVGRVRSLARERVTGRAGLLEWLRGYDMVLDTRSGDSFADIYGLRRLARMTAFAELATEAGVPVVLAPQTIGPFSSRRGRALARWTLRRATTVLARDGESARCAQGLGRPVDALTTDVVFALPVPEVERTRDVVLNVSGLLWRPSPHVDAAAYRRTVEDLLGALAAADRRVTLLAHVLDSPLPDNDVPVVRALAQAHEGVELVVPADLAEVREVVASARVVVGSRMHACLNALSVGTPAVPLAYSRKFGPLLADLRWDRVVDLRTAQDPVGDVMAHLGSDDLDDDAARSLEIARAALAPAVAALRALG
ncbi:polysaccharide pyruvyl transferase family protein [Actinotalea subterranea]|uniref:polysaccharide pyruvyl transferase family protein n=1 Tax=Actinotalea subterranea TaxID=2607497 RepID=UPI0011EF877C|nr:polysaccharide pyruvyl transferase family protein [Actinotalea subterranea]